MSDFLFDKNKQAHFRPSKKNIFYINVFTFSYVHVFQSLRIFKKFKDNKPISKYFIQVKIHFH